MYKQDQLIEHFVTGKTARCASELVGANHNTDLPPIFWSRNKLVYVYLNYERIFKMAKHRKPRSVEQIIGILRGAEIKLSSSMTVGAMCRDLGILDATYYKW